jgi:hypothetical protein
MNETERLKTELIEHLIDSGFTLAPYSLVENEPPILRPVKVQVLLDCVLDYMIGAGYASPTKTT